MAAAKRGSAEYKRTRHLAAVKSWRTRRRNAEGPTQQRKDWLVNASPKTLVGLVRLSGGYGGWGQHDDAALRAGRAQGEEHGLPTPVERRDQKAAEAHLREGLKQLDIPGPAVDGLRGVVLLSAREFPSHRVDGDYHAWNQQVRLNATQIAMEGRPWKKGLRPEGFRKFADDYAAKRVAHEIGHHAHLKKISDAAYREWEALSENGAKCQLSLYGGLNSKEHFAEAFREYTAHGGSGRENLAWLEPESAAFMKRLFSDSSMWLPKGQVAGVRL